jgi:hypothetical protein
MPLDRILHQIQLQIDELAPTLEVFVDQNVQPSVQDCNSLQKQLVLLQETLAVYKYNKQNKEISPSFNLHARVSEQQEVQEKKAEQVKEFRDTLNLEKEEKTELVSPEPPPSPVPPPAPEPVPAQASTPTNPASPKAPLSIGLNDKFRFINELFAQNASEYHVAIEQINNLSTGQEAELYLNSLKSVYSWDEQSEAVRYFFSIVQRRFL